MASIFRLGIFRLIFLEAPNLFLNVQFLLKIEMGFMKNGFWVQKWMKFARVALMGAIF